MYVSFILQGTDYAFSQMLVALNVLPSKIIKLNMKLPPAGCR